MDYYNQTVLNPLGLLMTVACGVALLLVPRRLAIVPLIAVACLIAPAQRFVILDLNFTLLRVMVLFGLLRVSTRGETAGLRWQPLDSVSVAICIAGTIAYTALWGTFDAFKNQLGESFDAIGVYFLFRCLIRDWVDIDRTVLGFVIVSIPVTLAFCVERATGHNVFAFMGGVPAITIVREGRLRCQGAFAHPILAGCFWASLVPLFAARWWGGRTTRLWGLVGLGTAGALILLCSSGTPVMAVLFSATGAAAFLLRRHMRKIRWSILFGLIALHLVMKAPVWHLIARLDIVGGNDGWHRYYLIDQAIKRFDEWYLVGTKTTAHWDANGLLWDVTNQYVLEGVRGGFVTMALFIAAITLAFGSVGRLWRRVEREPYRLAIAWALGVSLFVHCMNFFAVSYFGQITMLWQLTLAMIASLSERNAPAAMAVAARRVAAPHPGLYAAGRFSR